MAHSENIISKVNVLGTVYEIHDPEAIHSLGDLGLERVMQFKGAVASRTELPTSGANGDVWHIVDEDTEVIWVSDDDPAVSGHWEDFGSKFVTDHVHDFTGSATVTGTNAASNVTASGSISVPKVTKSANYAKVSTVDDTFVKSYPGATSKMVTTSVTPAGSATAVVNKVTPSTGSVTGVSGSTTASKATAGTAVAVAKAGTAVSIPNVTNKGSASTWSFSVSDGVLTISGANGTAPTLGTAISVTPAVSNGSITPYTFSDITVPVAASSATTVVTSIDTDSTNVATVGTAVTVATGSLASNGSGSSVMTGLGTASTAKALTSADLVSATGTSDGILVGDTVGISSEDKTVSVSGTATAQTWTQKTGTISGTTGAPKEA